jgi:hypothetical protein
MNEWLRFSSELRRFQISNAHRFEVLRFEWDGVVLEVKPGEVESAVWWRYLAIKKNREYCAALVDHKTCVAMPETPAGVKPPTYDPITEEAIRKIVKEETERLFKRVFDRGLFT